MSGDDQALSFIYLLGCLVLVASGLLVRRVPIGATLKMAAGWVLIFLAVFTAFVLKDDFIALGKRVIAEGRGEGKMVQVGEELRIRKSDDGHFNVIASLNGNPVDFLIDSGATVTGITAETARRAGIEPSGGFPVLVETANGAITASRGRVEHLKVGTIERSDHAVLISEKFGTTNVLGMNFLSSLSSWGVEGEWLVLKP